MESGKKIIPAQLQNKNFGFVKLKPKSKKPFELDWQNKPYSYQDIQLWVEQGGNYGVQGGYGNLIVIDADSEAVSALIKNKLPSTFTVKTYKGFHYYYFCKDIEKKIVLKKGDEHFGDIIARGSQVVGAGSIHPDRGTEYQLINNVEIATISREQIYSELMEYIPFEYPQKDAETEIGDISVIEVLNKAGVQSKRAGNQLVCSHPVHGSTNGNNLVVHPDKNVWRCFRCDSGGGAITLIGVLEGVIDCREAMAGGLRGDRFKKVLEIAKEKYGFNIKETISVKSRPRNVEDVDVVEVFPSRIFPKVDFPLDVFPKNLMILAANISKSYNIPVDTVAVTILTLLSSAIGNSVRVFLRQGWQEPVFIWNMNIGRSGSGKSPFVNMLLEPIHELEREEQERQRKASKNYEIDLINYNKKVKNKDSNLSYSDVKPVKPMAKSYITTDTTIEALAQSMLYSPRGLLLYHDELSSFIGGHDHYSKNKGYDRAKYTELWNCKPWKVNRVSKDSMYIQNTGCSILGGIQPLSLPNIFKNDSFVDGLFPRFLISKMDYCCNSFSKVGISGKDMNIWQQLLMKCYGIELTQNEYEYNNHKIISFEEEAVNIFGNFHGDYSRKEKYLSERARVFIPKLKSYAVRLSGILQVIRDFGQPISPQTLKDTLMMIDYFAGQAMAMLKEYGKSEGASGIEIEIIRSLFALKDNVKNGKLKLSQIVETTNSKLIESVQLTPEQVAQILKKLRFETKLVGGYSYLIWDRIKVEQIFSLYIKASTTSTASTKYEPIDYEDDNQNLKAIVDKAEKIGVQCFMCRGVIDKIKRGETLKDNDKYHLEACLITNIEK